MNKRRFWSGLQRDSMSWVLALFCLLIAGAAAIYVVLPQMKPHTTLRVGDGVFSAAIVVPAKNSVQSVPGAASLERNQAVLYTFERDDKWPVEMKGRSHALDIVWLDHKKKVVYMVKNVTEIDIDKMYAPDKVARYVIELPVRTVDQRAISLGGVAVFDEPKRGDVK